MESWTRRDLTIVAGLGDKCIVIACDSCGAVGEKAGDVHRVPVRYAAKFTARVALSEVMCSGASPVTVTNGASCEMTPTGAEIVLGIQDELKNAGITDVVLTGSTEENFPASMTAFAVTVIGIARENELKFGRAESGDKIVLLGRPYVGREVDLEDAGFYEDIRRMLPMTDVREIVPAGSKGVMYEAETLADLNGMEFRPFETEIDFFKSAGPATCILALCAQSAVDSVLSIRPAGAVIGELL